MKLVVQLKDKFIKVIQFCFRERNSEESNLSPKAVFIIDLRRKVKELALACPDNGRSVALKFQNRNKMTVIINQRAIEIC